MTLTYGITDPEGQWWNNVTGWGSFASAELFFDHERQDVNLPALGNWTEHPGTSPCDRHDRCTITHEPDADQHSDPDSFLVVLEGGLLRALIRHDGTDLTDRVEVCDIDLHVINLFDGEVDVLEQIRDRWGDELERHGWLDDLDTMIAKERKADR